MTKKSKIIHPSDCNILPIDKIIFGDAIAQMDKLPSNSVDMVFADPPYNLQIGDNLNRPKGSKVDGVTDDWDKFNSFEHYDEFSIAWLSQAKRILKKDGTLWLVGSYHNIFRLGKILQDLGYWILNDVVWHKSNPMPNFRGRRFTNAHETLIWAAPNEKSKYHFAYHSLKAGNEDVQQTSIWHGPICTGAERLKDENGKKQHPTQKPLYLLEKIIRTCTKKEDVILDPFFGTGTTGAAARRYKRHYIGIESNKPYIKIAKDRIKNIKPIDDDLLVPFLGKQKQKTSFVSLIEQRKLNVGSKLYSKDKIHQAVINFDGSLLIKKGKENIRGSIHQTSSEIQGNRCNGWDYWFYEKNDILLSINELRPDIKQ